MKKILFTILGFGAVHIAVAQYAKVFPDHPDFKDYENVVSEFQGYLGKNQKAILTPAELADCLKVTGRAEAMMNIEWKKQYSGYIKRVEATICFKTALLIGAQPTFSYSQELMKQAQHYVDMGFIYLNLLDHSNYPPGIELDGSVYTTQVDEESPTRLRDYIYENTGEGLKALQDYYDHFDLFYSLHAPTGQNAFYIYEMVENAINLSLSLKIYDQNLVDFCFGILVNNSHGKKQADFMGPAEQQQWNKLQPKLLQALSHVLANAPKGSKFRLAIPQFYPENTQMEWVLPLVDKFDRADMLLTYTSDGKGNRITMDLMQYAAMIVENHPGGDMQIAAEALLQKHFHDLIDVARIYYKPDNATECNSIRWIAEHMDRYPVDEDGKKFMTKCVKKCNSNK